ncbi:MAG: DUF4395 family protein [Patescibacteria group bacterium]|jgi:hypothetical protein
MTQCTIYNQSLRFSRATYGVMTLLGFLLHNQWLILAAGLLTLLGVFSLKLNIPYQLHAMISRKSHLETIQKDLGEINFVAGMTGVLLLIGFFLVHYGLFVDIAWIYILIVDLLIFLACFVGFCVATLMYIFFKKIFNR